MALRILDYENVGPERKIKSTHPDHAESVLPDSTDPNGPKLQLHFKFFLDNSLDPLSSSYFDNTEILL
jgi:hypothetical protein